jgi:O-methyltransferase involved in polyketide biosynthesis
MTADKIHLTKENETYLITLYGKALDSRTKNPILNDTFADETVRKIDFDFEKLKSPAGAEITLPLRAKHLDDWTREFLTLNPDAVVLNLGCGLDSRVFRIDPPPQVLWYDVDFPDVIELRRKLYPERPGYAMIGSSVTDPGWLDGIPADRPVIVVAEGMLPYLAEQEVTAFFRRITGKFPRGQVVFDAYSRFMVRLINLTPAVKAGGITLRWGIRNPRDLEKQVPRLRLVTAIPFLTMPELIKRMPASLIGSIMFHIIRAVPFLRNLILHVRYEFQREGR